MTPRASHYRAALLALSLALSACTSIEVALGMRTRLQDMPVRALSASLSPGPGLAPGRSARLIVIATTEDGKQHITVGPGHGDVLFDSFGFDARIAQVSAKGVVTLPADPRLSEGQTPHVRINALGHPGVSAELDIPVRYDVAYVADFSGRAGTDGFPGSNGASGMTGNSGSIDATHPAPGGDGTRGDDGGNGGDGSPGARGQDVHVWLRLGASPRPLLQVRVASAQQERLYLLDPQGGTLAIAANGGQGGGGGAGGKGGAGGNGGNGIPPGFSGLSGKDGLPGIPGRPGAAGSIVVSVDPGAQAFVDRLKLSNNNGSGVPGPAPEIRVEPVAPLW